MPQGSSSGLMIGQHVGPCYFGASPGTGIRLFNSVIQSDLGLPLLEMLYLNGTLVSSLVLLSD